MSGTPDHSDLRRFLGLLYRPGDVFEVRAPKCRQRAESAYTSTVSGYFAFDAIDRAVAAIAELDESALAPGVYVTLNPVRPDLLARAANRLRPRAAETTADADVPRRRWVLVDVDPTRPSGVSATDAELELARERAEAVRAALSARGWPAPAVAMSGNGYHLLYRADLPADDGALVRGALDALAAGFGDGRVAIDRSVFNPARIVKAVGTVARKGDDLRGQPSIEDRPHRRSRLVDVPAAIDTVTVAQLEALAASTIPARAPNAGATGERFPTSPAGVRAWLEARGVPVRAERAAGDKTLLLLDRCPVDPGIGSEGGSDIAVLVGGDGKLAYCNKHNRGRDFTWHDLRRAIDPDYAARPAADAGVDLSGLVGAGAGGESDDGGCEAPPPRGADLTPFVASPPPPPDDPLEPAFVCAADLHAQYPALRPPVIHGLLRAGETMNVIASPKTGKALDIHTPILTADGWLTMEEIRPGMFVHASDGSLTRVVAVSEIMHDRPCVRVGTRSGAALIADEQHLWSVVRRSRKAVVRSTELLDGPGGRRWLLPVAQPLDRPDVRLRLDPWTLGYWLGNGSGREGAITMHHDDEDEVVGNLRRAGFRVRSIRRRNGAATCTALGLTAHLRDLGLADRKHIPQQYLTAGTRQRAALLAGLLDADGHASTAANGSGAIEFCSTNRCLAAGALLLARSLGFKASIRTGRASLNGVDQGQKHRVCFGGSRHRSPFSLRRKTNALPERATATRSQRDGVASVEPVGRRDVVCIQIEHPSGEFVAGRDLVVTHNSWLTLDLAIAVATGRPWLGRYQTEAGPVLIIDNELHRETSAHRLPKVAQARGVAMREVAERIFVDNLRGRLRDIFTLAPYFEALEPGRFKVIVLDAFYRFMPAGGDENDNGTMANIYNRIDAFADRLGCCFVLIHHSTKGSQSSKSVTDVGAGAGAQSRATDTHLVLRPHEESGVVVLDAAVRSWPPIDPTCLRWDFPVWSVDETLDPAALKNERPGKKKDAPPKADKPADEAWSVERFVAEFISGEPLSLAELRERVKPLKNLPMRRAEDLLSIAESRQLIERRKLPGRGGPVGFVLTGSAPEGGGS